MDLNRNLPKMVMMPQFEPVKCTTKITHMRVFNRREMLCVMGGLSLATPFKQTSPVLVSVIEGWTLREGDR
jgi:hypothetical protein